MKNPLEFFKKDYVVGLDIGSSSVKAAQLASKEGGLRLIRAEVKEIKYTPDKALREKEIIWW